MRLFLALFPAWVVGASATIVGMAPFEDAGRIISRVVDNQAIAAVAIDAPLEQVESVSFQFAWSKEFLGYVAFEAPQGVEATTDLRTDGPVHRLNVTVRPVERFAMPYLGQCRFICNGATYTVDATGKKTPGPVALSLRSVSITFSDGTIETIPDVFNPDRLDIKRKPSRAALRLTDE